MKLILTKSKLPLFIMIWFLAINTSNAATYNVTSPNCSGSGSLLDAVNKANLNPGEDTIEIASGLEMAFCGLILEDDFYQLTITESLIINGNSARVLGKNAWISTNTGALNPIRSDLDPCPGHVNGDTIIGATRGFARIGVRDSDNSGIRVEVNDLSLQDISSIGRIEDNAQLELNHVVAHQIRDIASPGCNDAAITIFSGADLTIDSSVISSSKIWDGVIIPGNNALIVNEGNNGNNPSDLIIRHSLLLGNKHHGAISWSGDVDIISSSIVRSGGLFLSDGTSNFINSIYIDSSNPGDAKAYDWLVTDNATLNVIASTISFTQSSCEPNECYNFSDPSITSPIQTYNTGGMNFFGSAVQVLSTDDQFSSFPTPLMLNADNQSSFSADQYSFIQPVLLQSAGDLLNITGQPNLITDQPAMSTGILPATITQRITPLLGTTSSPGLLIDAIPDSGPGGANELKEPNNTTITTDVYGHPRVDANDRRNIGAVQITLSPLLSITGIDHGSVDLAWTRPLDPSSGTITGYAVLYRHAGTTDAYTRMDISGADVLTATVSGLESNTAYEFEVVAVNPTGDGPISNHPLATTLQNKIESLVISSVTNTVNTDGDHTETDFHVTHGHLVGVVTPKAKAVVDVSSGRGGFFPVQLLVILLFVWIGRYSKKMAAVFLFTTLSFQIVHADQGDTYITAGLGYGGDQLSDIDVYKRIDGEVNDQITAISHDNNNFGFFIRGGYSFNPWIGIDATYYEFGETNSHVEAITDDPQHLAHEVARILPGEIHGAALMIQGSYPFGPETYLEIRAGSLFWKSENKATVKTISSTYTSTHKTDGSDAIIGIGIRHHFHRNVSIGFELTKAHLDDPVEQLAITLNWLLDHYRE